MDSSTPTRRDRVRREEEETVDRPDSRAPGEFDATVRFPPIDPFRLQSRAETRDYASLGSVARQIAAARTRPFALSTQTSSFEVLRPPRPLSPTVIVRSGPASLAAARPPHSPRPNPQIQPRPQPHAHAKTSLPNRSMVHSYRPSRSWPIRSLRNRQRKSLISLRYCGASTICAPLF